MCGIAGFLRKDAAPDGPIGERLLDMARILGSRGLESTGMALYSQRLPSEQLVLRVHLEAPSQAEAEARRARLLERVSSVATVVGSEQIGPLIRIVLDGVADRADRVYMRRLTDLVEQSGDAELFSIGTTMEIVKDVGPADDLSQRHCVSTFRGT